jgi:hypothetical protein
MEKYLMRIAVLLSGEYRKFDVCRDTMSFLLDDPVVDVYVSTWDKTRYLQNLINVSQTEFVNVEQIEQILNRPAVIEIESIDDYLNQRAVKYNNFMIHRWKQGINLIKNSNIKYDYIVISRFDLFFNPRGRNATLQEVINLNPSSNVLMATWSNAESLSNGILNDVFLLAPCDTMINLMDNLSIEEWVHAKENEWHRWWYSKVKDNVNELVSIEIIQHILCRIFSKKGSDYKTVQEHFLDWRDIQIVESRSFGIEAWSKKIRKNALRRFKSGEFKKYQNYQM